MTLLALALGPFLEPLRKGGVRWRFDAKGVDAKGCKHMGLIVVSKGEGSMLLKMVALDRIELWAEGIGKTRGAHALTPARATAQFIMEAVARFLDRCVR